MGSKIIAQFVGTYVAKRFPYVLLIDDDCLLPPNFPLVTERLRGKVQCIGYTIKSVGPNRSKGTLCQQAQDVEYKLSGIQRAFAGKLGSATFPHGAISIWDRELLIKTFQEHPGFSVSEDWFFGHVARQLGCRIQMCTSTFVETETPSAIFFSGGGARGGFGEMTIWKQRFFRWNFFFVNGVYYDMAYILKDWRLGWWEIGAKIFVFQEVYETLLYLLAPFVLPISFIVRPTFSGYLYAATLALYFLNVIIFNYVHLRSRGEMVSVTCLLYYMPYKMILTFVNIASCYYSIYKYAKYFAKRHAKVVEDENAVAIVLKLEENESKSTAGPDGDDDEKAENRTRHYSITAVGTTLDSALRTRQTDVAVDSLKEGVHVVDFAPNPFPPLSTSPEPLSEQTSPLSEQPRPLSQSFSRPRPWPRRSPSLGRRQGSYFPLPETTDMSQFELQKAAITHPHENTPVTKPDRTYESVIKDPSNSAPWPLREGSHALSPFSSSWPDPGSTFPAAKPAIPAMASLPKAERAEALRTQLQHQRSDEMARQASLRSPSTAAATITTVPANENTVPECATCRDSRLKQPGATTITPPHGILTPAAPHQAHIATDNEASWVDTSHLRLSPSPASGRSWPLSRSAAGSIVAGESPIDGNSTVDREAAEYWERMERRISPRFRYSVHPKRSSLPHQGSAIASGSPYASDGAAYI